MNAPQNPECDLAVIGAGPAGLAAATTAAECGLQTVLYDEQAAPGGQIYRAIENVSRERAADHALLGEDYQQGEGLVDAFRASAATYVPQTSVWEITPDGEIGILGPEGARLLSAKRVLITAGAMERPMPLPGWTLPGVMTAGAAQTLLKAAGQVPDVPLVLAGSGPLLFLVAWQLVKAGAPVQAILETTPRTNTWRALRYLPEVWPEAGALVKGWRWLREIRRHDVPIMSGVSALRCLGQDRVEAVAYRIGMAGEGRLDCGLVLLHQGVVPNHQLAAAAGCDQAWDLRQCCWRTTSDAWGATNVAAIAVAGDCVGIGGALAAEQQGRLAALDAAHRLGAVSAEERDRRAYSERRGLARQLGLRRFLDEYFRPAPWLLSPPDDDTVVCRCEEVTAGELRRVVDMGCPGPNQAKAFTRASMGPCQGRMCGQTISAVIASARGLPLAQVGEARVRPPLKPITVGELAEMQGIDHEVDLSGGLPAAPKEPAQP